MDFGHANRLNADRARLGAPLSDADFLRDKKGADALRSTLGDALASLRNLQDDEDLWARASQVEPPTPEALDELRTEFDGYNATLPALLELFGYREPPPPSARQAVSELVAELRDAGHGESPADEVAEARDALGRLLERAGGIEDAHPWEVKQLASDAVSALEMGISVATGVASGAVATVVASAIVGGLTGGAGVLAPVLILGGIRRWKRKRRIRERDAEIARNRELLHDELLPAAQSAVQLRLTDIAHLHERALAGDARAIVELDGHLTALMDITGRYVADSRVLSAARQDALRGVPYRLKLVDLLYRVNDAAINAKVRLYRPDGIDPDLAAQMDKLRRLLSELNPPGSSN